MFVGFRQIDWFNLSIKTINKGNTMSYERSSTFKIIKSVLSNDWVQIGIMSLSLGILLGIALTNGK